MSENSVLGKPQTQLGTALRRPLVDRTLKIIETSKRICYLRAAAKLTN